MSTARAVVLSSPALLIDGVPVELTSRPREVLTALALRAGTAVPDTDIITAVWGENPPKTVANQLQIAVHRLRTALGTEAHRLRRANGGYQLDLPTDLAEFRRHVTEGDRHAHAGNWAAARASYGAAVDLCEDVPAALAEEWLDALTRRLVADLSAGEHALVAQTVTPLVRANRLNERLWHLLVLAIALTDRDSAARLHAEATEALAGDAGLDPGREFRALADALARGDLTREAGAIRRWITGVGSRPVPMELPAVAGDFVGREAETTRLRRALAGGVVTVTGLGGVGKTALAVRVAREAAADYPDGCLFVDLRGADDEPHEPYAVLGSFLRSLGVRDHEVPGDLDARLSLYRSLCASRALLVVLDNAYDAAQVRDLVPSGEASAALVTARTTLPGLDTERVALESLTEDEAVNLLAALAGRRDDEDGAMRQVAALTGRLPLALRIVGARMSRRRGLTFARVLTRLTDEQRRLDELADGDRLVRSCIEIGYRRLSPEATGAIRAAAWLPVARFTLGSLAGTLGVPVAEAEGLVDELLDAQLMTALDESSGELAVYGLHDLVRLFAREVDPDHGTRRATLARGYRALLASVTAVERATRWGQHFPPDLPGEADGPAPKDLAEANVWLEAHRELVVAVVRDAPGLGEADVAWRLTTAMTTYLTTHFFLDDLEECLRRLPGLTGAPEAHAAISWSRAKCLRARDQPAAMLGPLREARLFYRRAGDRLRAAGVAWDLVGALRLMERRREAIAAGEWGLARLAGLEPARGVIALRGWLALSLGNAYIVTDQERGLALYETAAESMREVGHLSGEANALAMLGSWRGRSGGHDEAVRALLRALELYELDDSPIGALYARVTLVDQYVRGGDLAAAEAHIGPVIEDATRAGQRTIVAQALRALAVVRKGQDRLTEAAEAAERALAVSRETTTVNGVLLCLRVVAEVAEARGDAGRVREACEEAVALAPAGSHLVPFFRERLES